MNKNQKMFLLFILFLIILLSIKGFSNNKTINYKLENNNKTFKIKQTKTKNYYYIEVKTKNNIYPIQLYDKYKKKELLTHIYSYKDSNYECIVPIINDEVVVNGMCYKDKVMYDINKIDDKNIEKFIKSIKKYNVNKFEDNLSLTKKSSTITYYKSNKIKKSVAITTYKGLYNNNKFIQLFDKDIYANNIHTFIDKYYVTADYNSLYEFNKFYIVNLEKNKVEELKLDFDISFDSYIQGIVDNEIYLYDIDNEIQYKLNVVKKQISVVSNDKIKNYKNGNWEYISKAQAKDKTYFQYGTLDDLFRNYYKYFKDDKGKIYYVINKNLDVYKIYNNDKNMKKYLFSGDINIEINNEYIYFVSGDTLYYYSDKEGLRSVLKNTEFEFNDKIKYYIY